MIDYGLSRAKFKIKNTNTTIPEDDLEEGKSFNDQQLEGRVAFKDLEQDLEIFQGPKGQLQFETYRQYVPSRFTFALNNSLSTDHVVQDESIPI